MRPSGLAFFAFWEKRFDRYVTGMPVTGWIVPFPENLFIDTPTVVATAKGNWIGGVLSGNNLSKTQWHGYTFLTQTDHVTSEILEQLIQDLSEATVGEFIEAYLRFMANVKVNYADILRYRRMAREEIKKLEEERTLTESDFQGCQVSWALLRESVF